MKLIESADQETETKVELWIILKYVYVLFSSVVRMFCAFTDHHVVTERQAGKQNSLAVAEQVANKL